GFVQREPPPNRLDAGGSSSAVAGIQLGSPGPGVSNDPLWSRGWVAWRKVYLPLCSPPTVVFAVLPSPIFHACRFAWNALPPCAPSRAECALYAVSGWRANTPSPANTASPSAACACASILHSNAPPPTAVIAAACAN